DHVPVHLLDIHLEKGMHCVDCHFVQDVHGNTRLQQEVRAAIEIQCVDCHGTAARKTNLKTSWVASYTSGERGRDLSKLRTPSAKRRSEWKGGKLYQNSMVEKARAWEVVQTADTIDPGSDHYNEKSALAKTVRFGDDGAMEWGDYLDGRCAHANDNMSC